jgi:methylenetetrahydrofolate reductase (NADPH)
MTSLIDVIADAGKNWSIEVTPSAAGKIKNFSELLAEGTTVNVTSLAGADPRETVDVAIRLRDEGMNPVPHIPARLFKSKEQLDERVADMASRAGVDEVLVIAGGVDKPVGDFASSMDVLETGILQKYGIRKIGVSGHPEGSPDIPDDALAEAIAWKNDFARSEGLDLYMETQFCFEAAAVVNWERSIRAAGNSLPIRIGIPGPATIKTLFRFAQLAGIGPSMRIVAKQAGNVTKLLTVQSPHLLVTGLAEAMAADPECRIQHFHYYPFGGFARTSDWASAVAEGNIEFLPKGGFTVHEFA